MAGQRNYNGKRSHSRSDYDDDGGRNKRRNSGEERESFAIGPDDTVYRYLCPGKRIGSIIGKGGEIVKQLRSDTKSKIRIGETVPGCDERVVTIYSSSEETNDVDGSEDRVCPSQDALYKIHERVIADDVDAEKDGEDAHVIARLIVPSDQIGCIIGKGGKIVQDIRSDSGAQVRIMKDEHLPACALQSDELVQISGEPHVVRKALFQIASRLHDNPSRSQHLLASSGPNMFAAVGPPGGGAIMGLAPPMYGNYRGDTDWSRSYYSGSRRDSPSKEFTIRLVCPTVNIGAVIGKGGSIINQIRQESGAGIKVDSSSTEGDDCIVSITSKEYFEDTVSPAIEAAIRLQPRCSEKVERDSGIISFTTCLLVHTSRIGCLIGKGGSIVSEMRRITKANIRILSKENLPKVAAEDDEMVQISAELDLAKDALVQVTSRLRANIFDRDREGYVPALVPVLPYLPMPADSSDSLKYESRERRYGREHSGGYRADDLPAYDGYGSYSGVQSRGSGGGGGYGSYGDYSSGRSGSASYSGQSHVPRRKNYDY